MREQETGGKIFFIDGTGAWGNPTPQNVAYGAAKRAITQVKVSAFGGSLHHWRKKIVLADRLCLAPPCLSLKQVHSSDRLRGGQELQGKVKDLLAA